MAVVLLEEGAVLTRGQQVQRLLSPISSRANGPAFRTGVYGIGHVIAAHDGNAAGSDYEQWKFKMHLDHHWASYSEIWRRCDDADLYYLYRAYLSASRIDGPESDPVKLLCLHCDPNEDADAAHARYKRGPHLHVYLANTSFRHAHLALYTQEHLQLVLDSCDTFFTALEGALAMIVEEELLQRLA